MMATWDIFFLKTLLKLFITYLEQQKRKTGAELLIALRKETHEQRGWKGNQYVWLLFSIHCNVLVRDMIHLCWWKLDYKCCWSRKGILKGKYAPAFMAEQSAARLLIGYMTNPVIEEQPWLEPQGAEVSSCPVSPASDFGLPLYAFLRLSVLLPMNPEVGKAHSVQKELWHSNIALMAPTEQQKAGITINVFHLPSLLHSTMLSSSGNTSEDRFTLYLRSKMKQQGHAEWERFLSWSQWF